MPESVNTSLRRSIARLHEQASLRQLAANLGGISHQSLFKLLQGGKLRPSTLRRISDGLTGSQDVAAYNQVMRALGILLRTLGVEGRGRAQRRLAEVVEDQFRVQNLPVPMWVHWLFEGQRSAPTAYQSVDRLLKEVQRGSKGGAGARQRRD